MRGLFFTYFPFWDWIGVFWVGFGNIPFMLSFICPSRDRFVFTYFHLGLFLGMHIIDVDSNYGGTILGFFSFLGVFRSWSWD